VSTDSPSASPPVDPYDPRPTWWQVHQEWLIRAVVFLATIGLTVISFPPFKIPEAAYAMLVPGILWAYHRPGFKEYAWTMLGAQMVAWTILLGWLHNVTWVGLFLLGPFVGVWVGSWFLAAWWVMPRMPGRSNFNRLVAMCGLAGAWVIIEWTRTWLLGGFPWLPLAASQWERITILQVAAYSGAYGVSFVLVAMNIGFSAYAHRLFWEGATGFAKRSQEFFLALFLLLTCLCIHFQEAFNRPRFVQPVGRIALVQPYIPQEVKWNPARRDAIIKVLEDTTLAAAASRPDLILWPEAVTPIAVNGDLSMKVFVENIARRTQVPLLLGSIATEHPDTPQEEWRNGAFVVRPATGLAPDYYAKRKLVPFGEFVPLRPVLGWLSKFVPIGDDFIPGTKSSPLLVPLRSEPYVIGPLICYEDVYPQLARRSVQDGAAILAVLTNNAWFGEGGAAYQHASHSVLRAVETRRPVLRCGNGGWSGWIDEFGGIRGNLVNKDGTIYFRGAGTMNVTRDARWIGRESFYVTHGDWFVLVCAVLIVIATGLLKAGGPPRSRYGFPADEAG
jgi:apolipoprotein N-acyltransferase